MSPDLSTTMPDITKTRRIPLVPADSKARSQRLAICAQCEHLRKSIKQCVLCGCFVPAKAWAESSKCPDGRW